MSENQKYPYDDDFMRFDKDLNQYLLTEAALLKFGVDIRARLSAAASVSPENEIDYAVYRVSNLRNRILSIAKRKIFPKIFY